MLFGHVGIFLGSKFNFVGIFLGTKYDFVVIQISIDQEKNIDYLKSFFFGHFEVHLGNLKFLLDQSCVCIYVFIYLKVRIYIHFQFIYPLSKGIL
jgi:hypothetical protein